VLRQDTNVSKQRVILDLAMTEFGGVCGNLLRLECRKMVRESTTNAIRDATATDRTELDSLA
jgi:hypothetical protein